MMKIFVCALGLAVTVGLSLYELRNSALHDDLISRGRKLEDVFGVDTGIFRGRLKSGWIVKHSMALGLLYAASIATWVGALLYLIIAA